MRYIDYDVVHSGNLPEFIAKVKARMAEGWEVIGGISVSAATLDPEVHGGHVSGLVECHHQAMGLPAPDQGPVYNPNGPMRVRATERDDNG